MGLSFGLGSLLLAGCDSASEDTGPTGTTSPTTSTSTGGGVAEGTVIPFADGWVPLQDFGIQGAFYTFGDFTDGDSNGVVGTSTITPESFAGTGAKVCASGMAGVVVDKQYSDYWGAAVGLNLSQEENVDTALPYNATMHGVTGFSFTIEGTEVLPADGELRFNVKVAGDTNNYCAEITSSGNVSFRFSELQKSCWEPEAVFPDATNLEALHWQYVTNDSTGYAFDICITELRALTN
jgi:hypothetical protein